MTAELPRAPLAAGLVILLGLAAPAAGQDHCGDRGDAAGVRVSAIAGAVRYDLAGDRASDGVELGLEAGLRAGGFGIRGGLHHVLLGDAPANPTTARLRLTREVLRIAGVGLCGVALAGGSVVSSGSDNAVTVGGGIGITAAARLAAGSSLTVAPFLGARLLGASATGEVLGESFSVSGGSVGGEGGVAVASGRTHAALRLSMDGFDPALGATSYPALALRLSLGWRF